jgi:hypothetical protein
LRLISNIYQINEVRFETVTKVASSIVIGTKWSLLEFQTNVVACAYMYMKGPNGNGNRIRTCKQTRNIVLTRVVNILTGIASLQV